ncbi:hypothetical protein FACS189444_4560 [Spirochaetia bacterium]|nr:hypothetical protein FACS189444_4560 [Spirochaetia bacterium]
MPFSSSVHNTVRDLCDLQSFSEKLSKAIANIPSIQTVHTRDTFGEWGVAHKNHDVCYGRTLIHTSTTCGNIPFWVGLDITKAGTQIVVTFDNLLLKTLNKITSIKSLPGTFTSIPKHCNVNKSTLVEINLEVSHLTNFKKKPDDKILLDFLSEILNGL